MFIRSWIISAFHHIASLVECVAMVDFIKGAGMLRIATEACADRFLRTWIQR